MPTGMGFRGGRGLCIGGGWVWDDGDGARLQGVHICPAVRDWHRLSCVWDHWTRQRCLDQPSLSLWPGMCSLLCGQCHHRHT